MAALTPEDLLTLWQSSVDSDFARALLSQPDSAAAVNLSAQIFAAASQSIEVTNQSLFLKRWSGQTSDPASGGAKASVVLELSRTAPAEEPIVLIATTFITEEEVTDSSDDGAVMVPTGRRFFPGTNIVFLPGESTVSATFFAERIGGGWNLPGPGSITRLDDAGSASGDQAAIIPGASAHRLVLSTTSETIPPSAVGQYILLSAGANQGQRRRVIGYEQPDPDAPNNGVVVLAPTLTLAVSGLTGFFIPGELIEQVTTGASAALLDVEGGYLVADRVTLPDFAAGGFRGVVSGATGFVNQVLSSPAMTAELATAGWELLTWVALGLSSTNPKAPSGGLSPTLDHVGEERQMGRAAGEQDEPYRKRLAARPDVVTPNALIRSMNRVLAPYGLTGCFREPSDLQTVNGLFYDSPAAGPVGFRYAYDQDGTSRAGADRWKVMLDLAEYRGFFVASIPPMSIGEFGCAYDEGFVCFYDASPFNDFYDGFPATAAAIRIAVWNALNKAREAGVGFELVEDRFGC